MTARSLWPHALEEFCAVEIPASEGPVAEVGHYIAPSCIIDERLWSSGGSSNPLIQTPLPPLTQIKRTIHVPAMLFQWLCKGETQQKASVALCQAPVCVCVYWTAPFWLIAKFLKAIDLRLQPSFICQFLSANSHQNPQGLTLYALLLSVFFLYSFVCLASHLIFILPL